MREGQLCAVLRKHKTVSAHTTWSHQTMSPILPPLRRSSTSFSKLADFRLDDGPEEEEKVCKNVALSIDAK